MTVRSLVSTVIGGLLLSTTAVMAAESVYPRVYTADDCQLLNSQIDDSIRFSNINSGTLSTVETQRVRANMACSGGQYAVGTRQLRDVLDEIIAARGNS